MSTYVSRFTLGAPVTEPSRKNKLLEQPTTSPSPSANKRVAPPLGHPSTAFGDQGGARYAPPPGKPLNQFDDSEDEEDTQSSEGGGSESVATAASKMDFGKPLNEFNEPLPTEHVPADGVGQRSNALMQDRSDSDEDTPGGQSTPLTLGHTVIYTEATAAGQPSHTFGLENLPANASPGPPNPSSESALATAGTMTFGQPLNDKGYGGEVHTSYRTEVETLPPVTQTLPNPTHHSGHAQFSTQTSVSTTTGAASQVTSTAANDFNIATSGTRTNLYTNNLRAHSERSNEERVTSELPSDSYSNDEPPLRAHLNPAEEQLSLAQKDDGDRSLFAPRPKTPPPERPPSPTASGRTFHSVSIVRTLC